MGIGQLVNDWCGYRGIQCHYFEEIDSTNTQAKKIAFKGNEAIQICVTDYQVSGRGRNDNQWITSSRGQNLLLSWLIPMSNPPQHFSAPYIGYLTIAAAEQVWPDLSWSLKAPNDILLNGKKVAGILLETISQADRHALVFGLGLNLYDSPSQFEESTFLDSQEGLSGRLKSEDLLSFIDELFISLGRNSRFISDSELPTEVCSGLKEALNANPNVREKFERVDSMGNLYHKDKVTKWEDL